MTFLEIYELVKSGNFSDDRGNWKLTTDDIGQLSRSQILTLKSVALDRKDYYNKLADAKEAAERAGKPYTPPAGTPDVMLRNQAHEFEILLDEFLGIDKATTAERTFIAPIVAKNWLSGLVSDSIYKTDDNVHDLKQICKAAKSMEEDIERELTARMSDGTLVYITSDSERRENGGVTACRAGETCGLTQADVDAGAFFGFVTPGILSKSLAGLSEPTGAPAEQAKTWARRIVGAIRDEGTVFPKVIATRIIKAAPLLPAVLPLDASPAQKAKRQKEVAEAMKGARGRYKSELNEIERMICNGIDEAFVFQVASGPLTSSRASKHNAVAAWIKFCSQIPGSLYSFYSGFIAGRQVN